MSPSTGYGIGSTTRNEPPKTRFVQLIEMIENSPKLLSNQSSSDVRTETGQSYGPFSQDTGWKSSESLFQRVPWPPCSSSTEVGRSFCTPLHGRHQYLIFLQGQSSDRKRTRSPQASPSRPHKRCFSEGQHRLTGTNRGMRHQPGVGSPTLGLAHHYAKSLYGFPSPSLLEPPS